MVGWSPVLHPSSSKLVVPAALRVVQPFDLRCLVETFGLELLRADAGVLEISAGKGSRGGTVGRDVGRAFETPKQREGPNY